MLHFRPILGHTVTFPFRCRESVGPACDLGLHTGVSIFMHTRIPKYTQGHRGTKNYGRAMDSTTTSSIAYHCIRGNWYLGTPGLRVPR
eukprot:1403935-Rhodomonas_salina.1